MTISSETNSVSYNGPGNGFAYSYPVFDLDDVYAEISDADGIVTVLTKDGAGTYDFTLSGTYTAASYRYASGVTVTLTTALPSGYSIYIENRVSATQSSDYTIGGNLEAERLETDLDRLAVMQQKDTTSTSRAVKVAATSGISPTDLTPLADGYVKFNAAGTDIEAVALGTIDAVNLPLSLANGGTGGTSASTARTALGLVPGTDVQAYDALLLSLAGQTTAANKVQAYSGVDTATLLDFLDDDAFTADSATAIASQQSIKAQIATQVAAAASDGWEVVATWDHAIDGNSTGIEFTTGIDDTYDRYALSGTGLTISAAGKPLIQFQEEGGSFLTANYVTAVLPYNGGAAVTTATTGIPLSGVTAGLGADSVTYNSGQFFAKFSSFREAALDPHCVGTSSLVNAAQNNGGGFVGQHTLDPIVDGVRLVPPSGNITGGVVKLLRWVG